MKPKTKVTLGTRLQTYAVLLKQLDVVTQELETVGFVTLADRDRWEKLIVPERLRVGVAMKALGVSLLSRLPSLEAARNAGNGSGPETGIPALDAARAAVNEPLPMTKESLRTRLGARRTANYQEPGSRQRAPVR